MASGKNPGKTRKPEWTEHATFCLQECEGKKRILINFLENLKFKSASLKALETNGNRWWGKQGFPYSDSRDRNLRVVGLYFVNKSVYKHSIWRDLGKDQKIYHCSLQDIRKELPGQKFSMGCALSVGIQCLEAIEELHAIGFLHRSPYKHFFSIQFYLQWIKPCRDLRKPPTKNSEKKKIWRTKSVYTS